MKIKIVQCLTGMLLFSLVLLFNASVATGGVIDYAIDWVAAAPSSYDHATGGGAYDDRTLRVDVANALVGTDFTCGDIVSYLAQVTVDQPVPPETIEFSTRFSGNSPIAPGAGFVDIVGVAVNYGTIQDLAPNENDLDDGIVDDGGSTATLVEEYFTPATGLDGGSLYENPLTQAELVGVIRIDDLEATDTALVVRIDAKLDCVKGSAPQGNLQAELRDATIVVPELIALPIGIQNIILANVSQITFPPDKADLQLTQVAPAAIAPGDPLTYTIALANQGPDPAITPLLTNTLPSSITFMALTSPTDWQCTTPAVGETGVIGCGHDMLANGEVVTFTIAASTAPTIPLRTVLTNTVAVTSATLDPMLPNSVSLTTTVAAPVLYAEKVGRLLEDADDSGFLSPGDSVAYTITLWNIGNAVATGLIITDTVDPQSTLLTDTVRLSVTRFRQPPRTVRLLACRSSCRRYWPQRNRLHSLITCALLRCCRQPQLSPPR
ncbi:MAG: hypothetical protein R2932_33855 [Caldilineaceae bacterium]